MLKFNFQLGCAKKRIQQIIFLVMIATIFTACGEDDGPPIANDIVWDCHNSMDWDSLAVANFLIGEWEWEYFSCYENRSNANGTLNAGMLLDIKSDQTLTLKDGEELRQASSWDLLPGNDGLYNLITDPIVFEILGDILICEERIKFTDIENNGCDHFYKKK